MATSGSKTVKVTNWDTLKFSWEQKSQSVANNSTTITWKLQLIATDYGYITGGVSKDYKVTVNGTEYKGTNTVGISNNTTITLADGETTIKHSADGSKTFNYSFSQEFAITFSGEYIGTISGSGKGELKNIPRQATLSSAPNFNDEEKPVIKYSNPAGSAVDALEACIKSGDGERIIISYRDVSKTGSSYTFNFTEAERKLLWSEIEKGSSTSVRFHLRTTIGDATYHSQLTKTLSLINYKPTVTPTVTDIGAASTELTGNGNKIIKGFNYVTVSAGATANKGAVISKTKIACDGVTLNTSTGVFENVNNPTFTFTVTDDRGNTTTKTITKTLINYIPLTCKITKAVMSGAGTLELEVSGKCFNGSFGAVNNEVELSYRIGARSEGGPGPWVKITPTYDGNNYTATATITGLNYKTTYSLAIMANDMINQQHITEGVVGTPVFDWGKDDFKFNVPVYDKYGNELKGIQYLWGGAYYMQGSQTVQLLQNVSNQQNGIVLVFSRFDTASGKYLNEGFQSFFVPKNIVVAFGGSAHSFLLMSDNFNAVSCKKLYINDNTITGDNANISGSSNTGSGITYNNKNYVLRYVYGV